jgi:uncharacterized protein (TIGR03435 family)
MIQRKALKALLAVAFVVAPIALAQSPSIPPWETAAGGTMEFEVASIHLSKPGTFTPPNFPVSSDDSFPSVPTDSFTAGFPLETYLEFAYKLWLAPEERRAMLANLPSWVSTEAYEIYAKAEGNATKDQMRLMMQSLLADRFKLAMHFETREVPVLALTLVKPGKTGPKLRPHSEGPSCDLPGPQGGSSKSDAPPVFPWQCYSYALQRTPNHTWMSGSRNTNASLIAASLTSLPGSNLDRPVIDQTGLTGEYDFTLEWAPESNAPAPTGADAPLETQGGATFAEALREQLGLKLEPTKAPLAVPVIDHVERPSSN